MISHTVGILWPSTPCWGRQESIDSSIRGYSEICSNIGLGQKTETTVGMVIFSKVEGQKQEGDNRGQKNNEKQASKVRKTG